MKATRVIDIRSGQPFDVYIGRAGHGQDGYYGNPYARGSRCSRCGQTHRTAESTLPCFRQYFLERIRDDREYRGRVRSCKGLVLGCFCPEGKPCHGRVIAQWLDRPDEILDSEIDDLVRTRAEAKWT